MKNLLSLSILGTSSEGKTTLLKNPLQGKTVEETLSFVSERNQQVAFKQLTLWEVFQYEVEKEIFETPFTFESEDEKFEYWLRSMVGSSSEVNENIYNLYYETVNTGGEFSII